MSKAKKTITRNILMRWFVGRLREKQVRGRSFLAFLVLIFGALSVWAPRLASAQTSGGSAGKPQPPFLLSQKARGQDGAAGDLGWLSSASVGRRFYEIAYELAERQDVRDPALEQAIAFLIAAMKLDGDDNDVRSLLIKLVCRVPERDYSVLVYNLLLDYVDESADLEMTRRAVEYLLEGPNSREEREKLLQEMLRTLGGKNIVLGSELATSLGLLMAQKADLAATGSLDHARLRRAATSYLMQAYNNNRYNKWAFAKLAELMPEQIEPAIYLEYLRLALRENPSDIEAALAFAQYAEQLQLYETAEATYEYCADLFTYLYPSEPLASRIYLPWAISSYNMQVSRLAGSQGSRLAGSQRNHSKCLQIAERVRQDGRFDLLIEALAAKTAAKIGDGALATQIFQAAEEKARQLSMQDPKRSTPGSAAPDDSRLQQVSIQQFAWFYCFALPDPERALYWANEAYVAEPDSATAAAVLAYALVMNNQLKWAKPLVSDYQHNQIADLALAQIQLTEGQRDLAIETLRSVIAKDPGSLAAERAKEILARQREKYIPPVDPNVLLIVLRNTFGQTLVPAFTPPEQIISVQFNIRGNTFPYGSEFSGAVAIVNNSPEPLVISDDGLFRGNIRIDADISGDLNQKIPNLISVKNQTVFLVEPGRNALISLRLFTGELRKMLFAYPQASLDIEFTLYLDPVTTQDGKVTNRLTYLKPAKVRVKRPGIELTSRYLTNRFNSISEGQLSQKIKTAQLFMGLLTEQHAMSNRELPYGLRYADWVPPLLRSALLHESGLLRNPAEGHWVVKVHTMAEMLSLPLEISVVAENLNNTDWPVRMMAIYLLAKSSDGRFDRVLDWAAKNDSNEFVRSMAIALGGSVSQQ
jgi:tetratricopeptide (TPR) repeat protein